MGQHDSKTKGVDYVEVADGIDDLRETMRAAVAGLVSDGFTKREAHALLAGIFATRIKTEEEDNE